MSSRSTATHLETQARYALFASLAEGRRILDLGCSDARGLGTLAEAGAAEITAVAADPRRIAAALAEAGIEGIDVRADDGPLGLDAASFDLIVCHDLEERLRATPALVDELRRALDPAGLLAVAVPNPAGAPLGALWGEAPVPGMKYEDLYARLAPVFGPMTAFGQSPVAASLFYDLGSETEDPGLSFDRSLVTGDEQPGWFVLVFGAEGVGRDELTIVQLPFDELREGAPGTPTVATTSRGPAEGEAPILATERDSLLLARDGALAERDAAVAERDAALVDRDAALADRETALSELAAVLSERGTALAARDQLLAERELLVQRIAEAEARALVLEERLAEQAREHHVTVGRRAELEAASAGAAGRVEELRAEPDAAPERPDGATAGADAGADPSSAELELALVTERAERAQLESQLSRARHDGASLEQQIRDLLDESATLRRALEEARASAGMSPAAPATEPSIELTVEYEVPPEPSPEATPDGSDLARALDTGDTSELGEPAVQAPDLALSDAGVTLDLAATEAEARESGVTLDLAAPEVETRESGITPELAERDAQAPDLAFSPEAAATPDLAESGAQAPDAVSTEPGADLSVLSVPGDGSAPTDASLEVERWGSPELADPSGADASGGVPTPEPLPAAPQSGLNLDALVAEAGSGEAPAQPAGERSAAEQAAFGELEVGAPLPSRPRPRGPVTLDDLEDLLASSIPPPPPTRR